MNVGLPQINVPLVDPRTGTMDRSWFLFFQALYSRSGGSEGQTTNDLTEAMPEDSGIEEVKWQMAIDRDAANQSARIEQLEARVAQLMTEIDALKQGTTP